MGRGLAEMAFEHVEDRHGIYRLRERIARVERRLDLADWPGQEFTGFRLLTGPEPGTGRHP